MSLVEKSSQPYSVFSPVQVPGCALWLDAADSSSVTLSGSSVTSWRDKSGNGGNATATGTITNPVSINGLKAMSYSGATSTYFLGAVTNTGSALSTFSVFIMNSTSYAAARIVSLAKPTVFDYNSTLYAAPILRRGTVLGAYRNNVDATVNGYTFGTACVVSSIYTGATSTIYLNGTAGTGLASTGNFGYTNYEIGGSFGEESVANLNGVVGEVILYNGGLSNAQRQQVEGYLAAKWGLTANLPATHPYKLVRPIARPLSPLDVPGCTLWLDAADRSTMTLSGNNVTQWRDKSGNGFVADNSGTVTIGTSTQKQIPVLSMSSSSMNIASFSQSVHSTTIVVAKPIVDYYGWRIDNYKTYFGTFNNDLFYFNAATAIAFRDSALGAGVSICSVNAYHIFAMGYAGGTAASIYTLDGTSRSTIQTAGSAVANTTITGTFFVNGFASTIDMCEALVYNRSISTVELQTIEGYLAWKWGLPSSIPATHPFKRYPSLSAVFSPVQLSGCSLWLDGADTSTLTLSGSTVTQWRDKSGNGYSPSNTSATVTYRATGLNGRPTITNTNAAASTLTYSGTFINRTNCTLFVVIQRTGSGTDRSGYICFIPTSGTYDYAGPGGLSWGDGDGGPYQFYGGGTGLNQVTGGNPAFPPSVFALSLNNTAGTMYSNGTVAVTGTVATNSGNAAGFVIANRAYTGLTVGGFPGNISEVLVYNSTLTPASRQQIEGYLASKWGLVPNLPSTHPYKQFTP